jgi:hypothetical protein
MDKSISLLDIKQGVPGITAKLCEVYYEACMVCLHRCGHNDRVKLEVSGDINETITLLWEDYYNDQVERSWKEENTAEYGAICIAVLLVKSYTDYTIIEKSRFYDGVDYWLGKEGEMPFKNSARIEISGIFKESKQNSVNKRLYKKKDQTKKSDATQLPAYISIVEFGKPKAIFAKKIKSYEY